MQFAVPKRQEWGRKIGWSWAMGGGNGRNGHGLGWARGAWAGLGGLGWGAGILFDARGSRPEERAEPKNEPCPPELPYKVWLPTLA